MSREVAEARQRYQPPGPGEGLASVLPAALLALGAGLPDDIPEPRWQLPQTRRVVVVLVDGLGSRQLERRTGHAPFLRTLGPAVPDARCGFPSTTATSLSSLGTGRGAGDHGVIGWQTGLRGGQQLLNHLSWKGGPEPTRYQPHRTLLQEAGRRDVTVTTVSRGTFDGSGFTRAALRGGGYAAAESAEERTEGVLTALGQAGRRGRALVYAYWDEVDKAGHVHGPGSLEWGEAVEAVDRFVAGVVQAAPEGTVVVVTSDHGMTEAPLSRRRDLALGDVLDEGVSLLAGEPRAPQVWCVPGAAADVAATWRAELGEDAVVLTRDEAVEAGWFGPVREGVRERLGDLVVAMLGDATVLDSRLLRPEVLRLRGHHGSITDAETAIPLLVHQG
ncbi:alkaline phosphatase family protein [Ornithinimicrobium cerasi]|uniref:Type I phosphodiesterase / nucleotide pyrophosphatase n=1 Tax=Ornithinimicrobium cerasi TaxID=2248773 RepID=A0A285VE63_9MICO|nr:nucleotide pyrophosphatase/phosphodiesterase family protein [Ornithinimicrobium cerasi]SOC51376.1 Type I phosphodiesterase / nucleotide pyrophosphatase [Ornithinimicrobium cerasi]